MYQIQAAVAMEPYQVNYINIIATAAAGLYIDLYRGSHQIFIKELPMRISGELSYKHHCRASSRS
jgi:hypothetical protein